MPPSLRTMCCTGTGAPAQAWKVTSPAVSRTAVAVRCPITAKSHAPGPVRATWSAVIRRWVASTAAAALIQYQVPSGSFGSSCAPACDTCRHPYRWVIAVDRTNLPTYGDQLVTLLIVSPYSHTFVDPTRTEIDT